MEPVAAVHAGRQLLDPVLMAHGFCFQLAGAGNSSGGAFAAARYTARDREMAFSYRQAIGCVTYACGGPQVSHGDLMRLLGVASVSRFAWFDRTVPMAGFEALALDIQTYLQPFTRGTDAEARAFLYRDD